MTVVLRIVMSLSRYGVMINIIQAFSRSLAHLVRKLVLHLCVFMKRYGVMTLWRYGVMIVIKQAFVGLHSLWLFRG